MKKTYVLRLVKFHPSLIVSGWIRRAAKRRSKIIGKISGKEDAYSELSLWFIGKNNKRDRNPD